MRAPDAVQLALRRPGNAPREPQDDPRSRCEAPQPAQEPSHVRLGEPRTASEAPQTCPTRSKEASPHQDSDPRRPRQPPDSASCLQYAPGIRRKLVQESPTGRISFILFGFLRDVHESACLDPVLSMRAPDGLQLSLRRPGNAPRGPQDDPRSRREAPRPAQHDPRRPPRQDRDPPRRRQPPEIPGSSKTPQESRALGSAPSLQ